MSTKDPQIFKRALGCFLLFISISATAIENGVTKTQARDPFSVDRSTVDPMEYPSVLTAPDFEETVSSTLPTSQAAQAAKTAPAPTQLKTPVQPRVAGPISRSSAGTALSSAPPTRALILHENVLLSQGLDQWAKDAGYKMLWNSQRDYMIYSTIIYSGATEDVVLGDLGKLFASENYGLVIKLYQKNKVLVIDEQ